MLFFRSHFAKRQRMIVGLEERVVAKTLVAARLVDEAEDLALESFQMAVRPRYRQRRDEMRAPLRGPTRCS